MAKISVPQSVIEGFIAIASLSDNQIETFAKYLRDLPVGTKFQDIDTFINSDLKVSKSEEVVRTILSFNELLEPNNIVFSELAHNLTESVKGDYAESVQHIDLVRLEGNLLRIFENSTNLKLTMKAFDLVLENNDLYVNSKAITEIRLIFNDNMREVNRNGVIVHKLHLTIRNSKRNEDVFITMDSSDLKKLKDTLERAILKEEIIREDYKNINFVNL